MPTLVNPMDAMKSFEPALRAGEINLHAGETDPELGIVVDHPNGEIRFTCVRFRNDSIAAMAIIIPAEPYEGTACFQIGYAVPQHLRKRGYAKEIAHAAIAEFRAGLARSGVKEFYLEAVVGRANQASQKVAEDILGKHTGTGEDSHSGEPILQYIKKIGG